MTENLFNSNDIQSNSIENKNLLIKNMNIVFHQEGLRSGKSINHLIKEKKFLVTGHR